MIRFHGRPFLQYLLEHLREQGIQRVLLLLGYRADVVVDYFGDGGPFDLQIDYSITAIEDDTGRRLRHVRDRVDPFFLLLYCDNYWPMDLERMWRHFTDRNVAAQVTVYSNCDAYSRNNVAVDADGLVSAYDHTKAAPGLNGVEIGFALLTREVLDLLPDDNVNFEHLVYPALVSERRLAGYMTDHRYYSVGSVDRLARTEAFLARRPAIILDRDGVINVKAPGGEYVTSWRDFRWVPGSREAIAALSRAGYTVIVVTNQAGIARGMMSESDLESIHDNMRRTVAHHGGSIDAVYVCPHGWDEGCRCRKPKPGMLFQAQRDFNLDLSRTYFIGDDERDIEAGAAAGTPTLKVDASWPLIRLVRERLLGDTSA